MKVSGYIDVIGINQFGTRVIQKMNEGLCTAKLKEEFIRMILSKLNILINDFNGTHIVIKLIKMLSYPLNDEIYNAINENIIEISNNKFGSQTIPKCFEFGNDNQRVNNN